MRAFGWPWQLSSTGNEAKTSQIDSIGLGSGVLQPSGDAHSRLCRASRIE